MARLLVLLLLMVVVACEKHTLPPRAQEIGVSTFLVEPRTIPAIFEFVGVAQSSHPVEIRARVEGYLQKIAYREGDLVKKGDLLFQIDPVAFQASLNDAKGYLAKQAAFLWNANRTVERLEPLYKQKAASRKDLDDAIASQLSATAEVESAQAQVETAELNLSYTTITSPITGLTSESNFREGALITPGAQGLLTTISVVDPIWVNFSISENDILKYESQVSKGHLVTPKEKNYDIKLILSDGSIFPTTGKVNFANPTIDQATGTLYVRSVFDNPDLILRPGQFVRVQVMGAFRPEAVVVPQRAVQQGQKGMFVYVVDKDNKASPRDIQPGDWFGEYWIITAGLEKGDEVIVDGVNKVLGGSPVKVTTQVAYKSPENPKQ